MGKSILKHRSWRRVLTLVLVFAMLAAYVPAVGMARAADEAADSNTYVLDAEKELTAFAAGEKAAGDTAEAGSYFTILWSEKSKVDSSSKTWADGYSSGQRINFGGKATAAGNSVMFKTTGPATVKIWWVQGGDDNREMGILNGEGEVVIQTSGTYTKNDPYLSTLEVAEAGTYYLGGVSGNNYIFKVEVTAGGGAVERTPWAESASPVITEARQNGNHIDVAVNALVGTGGADKLTVTMTRPDGSKESKDSLAEKSEHTVSFTPSASGKYTFSVTAVRDGEETEHTGEKTEAAAFVLPLTAPVIKSVTNNGKGKITLDWNPVAEAEKYKVTVQGINKSVETKELTATFEGLTIDGTYTIEVVAMCAGRDNSPAGKAEHKVLDRVERNWVFATFGTSTSTAGNSYSGNANDGKVTVWSEDGKGKLVPNSTDGIAFYYTAIPTTENFRLTANIHVDSWTYSNGQDGFGLMVGDRVGASGAGADFWNNSYMAVITKVEYTWNGELNEVSDTGTKYAMRLGIGAQEKINVTPDNIGASNLASEIFKSTLTTLETSAGRRGREGGDYNIIGNNLSGLGNIPTVDNLTDFKLTIERNPTGYFVSYEDAGGSVTTRKYYDPDALSHLDKDYVYAGFFAARNARITVSDIELTTIAAADDDREVEEKPVASVTPSYTIESASIANSGTYDLVYYGNADGKLAVKAADGTELFNGHVTARKKIHIPAALTPGANTFTWSMTPDKGYHPDNDEFKTLSSYDEVSGTHTVIYAVHDRNVIYVSPAGLAAAEGSKADPMNIYEAVKKAAPGQTIVLLEGTYSLTSTVVAERGINGAKEHYITMMADPNAASRPVLDFGGNCAGMILAGDYWHLYGFDVTNSANGEKGIQVSGSHNVLERLLTYRNGNTGIQISRYKGSDLFEDWPADNLILNCSSYLNADSGYEDADGFAAKLTIGDGNVFDGCIAAYNADDGWDLYAKVETGPIGTVTIQNSVAFRNGWLWNEDGWWTKDSSALVNAGNGNGFKMGGESLPGGHTLINSVSFGNKAKGFDSNSCPDIKVYNSTSFNNNSYNVAFYTNSAAQTNFAAGGIISFKNNGSTIGEQFKVMGAQKEDELKGPTNYYYGGSSAVNSEGVQVTDDWFVHVDLDKAISGGAGGICRNADGSINMNGFLVLTDKAPEDAGARLENAEQMKAPELPGTPGWANPFTDVSEGDRFYDGIAYMVQSGLMTGVGNGEFDPDGTFTSGMLMTVLAHLDGVDTNGRSPWYQAGMEWAVRKGISDGTDPEAVTTREEFVAMLWCCVGEPAVTGSLDSYPDAGEVHSQAAAPMVWAVQSGIIQSTNGKLDPQGTVPRSEAAAMFTEFCLNIKK